MIDNSWESWVNTYLKHQTGERKSQSKLTNSVGRSKQYG